MVGQRDRAGEDPLVQVCGVELAKMGPDRLWGMCAVPSQNGCSSKDPAEKARYSPVRHRRKLVLIHAVVGFVHDGVTRFDRLEQREHGIQEPPFVSFMREAKRGWDGE